jgi:hypothetical protein
MYHRKVGLFVITEKTSLHNCPRENLKSKEFFPLTADFFFVGLIKLFHKVLIVRPLQ